MSLYQQFFEITMSLCKAFPALDPFQVRRTRAREVFLLIRRMNTHPKNKSATTQTSSGTIRRPAGDNWF